MIKQMFTADNFHRIFDIENRRGNDLTKSVLKDLAEVVNAVREVNQQIEALHKNHRHEKDYVERKTQLDQRLKDLTTIRNDAIDAKMEQISLNVAKPNFQISITTTINFKGKKLYKIDDSPESYFVIKQLQKNIHKVYQVKPSDRNSLVCRVKDTVQSQFPLTLVRTDIAAFYESVNQSKLLSKLDKDQLLSPSSKICIKRILAHCKDSQGNLIGLPRGIGASAYLAEICLRDLDRKIKSLPGIVLYCRYVDDILTVFAKPTTGPVPESYKSKVIEILESEGYTANESKTRELELPATLQKPQTFEYLGFEFSLLETMVSVGEDSQKKKRIYECRISPSNAKMDKYKHRLEAVFEDYQNQCKHNAKEACKLLRLRIKFLTGNTKLVSYKSGVATGIYYNNSIVNDMKAFRQLDAILQTKLSSIENVELRKQLLNLGFTEGFECRRFHRFSSKELNKIVKVWKNA